MGKQGSKSVFDAVTYGMPRPSDPFMLFLHASEALARLSFSTPHLSAPERKSEGYRNV